MTVIRLPRLVPRLATAALATAAVSGIVAMPSGAPGLANATAAKPTVTQTVTATVTNTVTSPGPTVTETVAGPTVTETTTVTLPPTTVTVTATPSTTTTTTATPSTTTAGPAAWPDASNTGAKGTLTVVTGNTEILQDGAVITDREFRGEVRVYGRNITLRNVKIVSTSFWALRIDGDGLLVEDTTISGGPDTQSSIVSGSASWTGRRLNLFGAGDGVKMGSNATLVDSWIHDLDHSTGAHNDGIELTGASNARVEHNSILNQNSQTSAVMLSEYYGTGLANVVVTNNLVGGGGFTVYGGLEAGQTLKTGLSVTNNRFTTRFFADSGYYGPSAYWDSRNTWTGNVWHDGPKVGTAVTP